MIDFKEIATKYSFNIDGKIERIEEYFPIDEHNCRIVNAVHDSLDIKYPFIDMSFLSMKNNDGTPKFSTFSIRDKECFFELKMETHSLSRLSNLSIRSNISAHKDIMKCYKFIFYNMSKKLLDNLEINYNSLGSYTLSSRISSKFSGIIPTEIKLKIKEVKSCFDDILIISEAEEWKYDQEIIYIQPNPDPLVIGVKNNIYYLIDSFNMTKIENYISKEFTS